MAGYRRVGDNKFTNATFFNSQIEEQRAAIIGRHRVSNHDEDLGVSRSQNELRSLFRTPDDVFQNSLAVFSSLDPMDSARETPLLGGYRSNSIVADTTDIGNPDFPNSTDLNFGKTFETQGGIYNEVLAMTLDDKPNKLGPNLKAPDINNINVPTVGQIQSEFGGPEKGFGWRDERNNAGTGSAVIGTYFTRHYNTSDVQNTNKPLFGEAKNLTSETNIAYDQPN